MWSAVRTLPSTVKTNTCKTKVVWCVVEGEVEPLVEGGGGGGGVGDGTCLLCHRFDDDNILEMLVLTHAAYLGLHCVYEHSVSQ